MEAVALSLHSVQGGPVDTHPRTQSAKQISLTPLRYPRVWLGALWLLVPALALLAGSAYWVSLLWAQTLLRHEAITTAALIQPELARAQVPRILDPKQRERGDWRWPDELSRLAASWPRAKRLTLWDANGNVIWSQQEPRPEDGSRPKGEIRQALSGEVRARLLSTWPVPWPPAADGIEILIPVRGPGRPEVLGVVGLSLPGSPLVAATTGGLLGIWIAAAGLAFALGLALLLVIISTSRRYAGHLRSLHDQLWQRARTVESTGQQLQTALETSERHANELNRLLEVAEEVGAAVSEEELYGTVARSAARACGVTSCSILLLDPARESLVPVSRRLAEDSTGRGTGAPLDSAADLSLDSLPAVIGEVVRGQRPIVLSADDGGASRWLELFQARSALIVPLVHQGRTAGILSLEHLREGHGFTPHQIQLATTLATQAAAAMDKARLYQEIAQRLRQTETLLAIMKILASTADFTEAVRQSVREIARALGADTGGAWCVAGGGEQLGFVAGYHVPAHLRSTVADTSVSLQDELVQRLQRTEGPLYASNSQADLRFTHPLTRLIGHKSLVLQPIQGGHGFVGFIALAWINERHAFKSDEINLLTGTARQLAVAVQLRRTQEQVSRQERLNALGQMASGIAHDFNNALVPIAGYSDLLLAHPEQLDDRNMVLRCLRLIQTGVRDAAGVVSRLREFYRRRKDSEKFESLDLNQTVKQVIDLTRPKWRDETLARGATVEMRAELAPVPSVLGSPSELREMLTNLIFNALDAMPTGGTITIRTTSGSPARDTGADSGGVASEWVSLEVSDTGVGMTEETRQRCLEPFYSTKGERGSGLGLAMVYGTVKRHRGTLDLDSAVGAGTRITLGFPAAATAKAEAPRRSALPARSLDVLVVDDEPTARDVLLQYLSGDGHRVETASNGQEGLERFKAGRFDVVLTDQAMPGLSGGELAAAVKALAPTVPVILVTGFGDIMEATDAQPAGIDLILTKPVSMAVLRDALAELTGQPDASLTPSA